jgi:adenylylsulfate kinase-like enzyme
MYQKILVTDLSGAGKTTLALALLVRLEAVVFNTEMLTKFEPM